MTTLLIADHCSGELICDTHRAMMATSELAFSTDGQAHVMVTGPRSIAEATARIAGVGHVIHLEPQEHEISQLDDVISSQVQFVSAAYSHIVIPATKKGEAIAKNLSMRLGVNPVLNVTRVLNAGTFSCLNDAGHELNCTVALDAIVVLTVETNQFEAASATGGGADIRSIRSKLDQNECLRLGEARKSNRADKMICDYRSSLSVGSRYARLPEYPAISH